MTDVLNRELGWRLRRATLAAGLNNADMARRMNVSESVTSRIMTGKRTSTALELVQYMTICDVQDPDWSLILDLGEQDPTSGVMRMEGADRWISLRVHTGEALHVTEFAPLMLPWAVQTPEYMTAIASAIGTLPEGVEPWGQFRIQRTDLAARSRQGTWTILLHEWALRTPVGGVDAMSAQLDQLLRLSMLPAVTLRVVPASAGEHAGMTGAFTLLEYAFAQPVVYREDATTGIFVETPKATGQVRETIEDLERAALSPADSRSVIRNLAVALYGSERTLLDSFAIGSMN
jgi:transcriptional regulator with XRE-family HTH domain